jgi:hypothetical protein
MEARELARELSSDTLGDKSCCGEPDEFGHLLAAAVGLPNAPGELGVDCNRNHIDGGDQSECCTVDSERLSGVVLNQQPRCEHPGQGAPVTEPKAPSEPSCSCTFEDTSISWQNKRLRFNPANRHTAPAQKKEILRRDGWCCSAPGCVNTVWLHIHHLEAYSEGGPTTGENLLSLCAGCHRNLHQGLLTITPQTDGSLLFSDSEGRRLDHQADLELAGWLDFWQGWSGEETVHQISYLSAVMDGRVESKVLSIQRVLMNGLPPELDGVLSTADLQGGL